MFSRSSCAFALLFDTVRVLTGGTSNPFCTFVFCSILFPGDKGFIISTAPAFKCTLKSLLNVINSLAPALSKATLAFIASKIIFVCAVLKSFLEKPPRVVTVREATCSCTVVSNNFLSSLTVFGFSIVSTIFVGNTTCLNPTLVLNPFCTLDSLSGSFAPAMSKVCFTVLSLLNIFVLPEVLKNCTALGVKIVLLTFQNQMLLSLHPDDLIHFLTLLYLDLRF